MKTISYYELLGMIKEGNAPEHILLNNFTHYFYDEKSGNYKTLDEEEYEYLKSYILDQHNESEVPFAKCIEIIEEVEEDEFEDIEELEVECDDGDIGINKKYIYSQQSEIYAIK